MNRVLALIALAGLTAACLSADVSYQEEVKYTGGSMLAMVRRMANMPMADRMAGGSMKSAFQDQNYTVYVKGSKLARLSSGISTIFDLDAGTITTINNESKTYMLQTFDELKGQMDRLQHSIETPSFDFDVKVDKTGRTRDINGRAATETVVTMTQKSPGPYGHLTMEMNAWIITAEKGMQEAAEFSKRLSERFSYAMSGMMPGLGAAGGGINAAMKESFQQGGYPIFTELQVRGIAAAGPMATAMGGGNADPNEPALKMETRNSSFSTDPVDDSKFSVPAGYTQQQPKE